MAKSDKVSKPEPGTQRNEEKAGLQYSAGSAVSFTSGSTSTPTPLVRKEGSPGSVGMVQKKDAKWPEDHNDMDD